MRILIILAAILSYLPAAAQNLVKYSNESIPFTTYYPSDWETKVKTGNRVFFTSPADNDDDNFSENVNIGSKEGKGFTNTFMNPQMGSSILESLKTSFTDFKLEKKSHYKFNGCSAMDVSYTVIMSEVLPGQPIKIRQIMFGKNGVLWTLTFTSKAGDKTWDAAADKIMKSVVVR